MFSVVIPLYNKEANIRQTLESVLNQIFTDFEIVIVNDGSKDNSRDVVLSMDDARIRLIDQENAGVSAARNRGIKEARGEWIAFLDADDLWREDKLEKYVDAILRNDGSQWFVSGYQSTKNGKVVNFLYGNSGPLEDPLDDLINGMSIHTSTVVVKKSYFEKDSRIFFKEGVNNSEDREVWYRLMFRYPRLYYINQVLSYYILDADTDSLTKRSDRKSHFLSLKNRLANDLEDQTILPADRRDKIEQFIDSFNRKALWYQWKNEILRKEDKSYLTKRDQRLMDFFDFLPKKLKLVILKLIVK